MVAACARCTRRCQPHPVLDSSVGVDRPAAGHGGRRSNPPVHHWLVDRANLSAALAGRHGGRRRHAGPDRRALGGSTASLPAAAEAVHLPQRKASIEPGVLVPASRCHCGARRLRARPSQRRTTSQGHGERQCSLRQPGYPRRWRRHRLGTPPIRSRWSRPSGGRSAARQRKAHGQRARALRARQSDEIRTTAAAGAVHSNVASGERVWTTIT